MKFLGELLGGVLAELGRALLEIFQLKRLEAKAAQADENQRMIDALKSEQHLRDAMLVEYHKRVEFSYDLWERSP